MTNKSMRKARLGAIRIKKGAFISALLAIFICYFAINLSDDLTSSVKYGMELAVFTVIPSTFPFMIISDFYTVFGHPERIPVIGNIFSFLTGIPKSGIKAFICGNVSGFPVGAKMASELYTGGGISREKAEKLCAYSNNPSIPFLLGAVGSGLYGSKKIGLFLLFTVYASTLITAFLFRGKRDDQSYTDIEYQAKFDITASIKSAGTSSLNIVFFITAFFTLLGAIKALGASDAVMMLFSLVLEVSSGVNNISDSELTQSLSVSLSAFTLGFGGLSVMMQSSYFMKPNGLKLGKYLCIKAVQGLICFIISYILYPFIVVLL